MGFLSSIGHAFKSATHAVTHVITHNPIVDTAKGVVTGVAGVAGAVLPVAVGVVGKVGGKVVHIGEVAVNDVGHIAGAGVNAIEGIGSGVAGLGRGIGSLAPILIIGGLAIAFTVLRKK